MRGFRGNVLLEFCVVCIALTIFMIVLSQFALFLSNTIWACTDANEKVHRNIYGGMSALDPEKIPCLELLAENSDLEFSKGIFKREGKRHLIGLGQWSRKLVISPEVAFVAEEICR